MKNNIPSNNPKSGRTTSINKVRLNSGPVRLTALFVLLALAAAAVYSTSPVSAIGKLWRSTSLNSASAAKSSKAKPESRKTRTQPAAAKQDSDRVRAAGNLNIERRGHTATPLSDGQLLIVGGENANGTVAQAEIYDSRTQSFTLVSSLNVGRTGHTAQRLADGRILISGGCAEDELLNSSEIYDPASGMFSAGPTLNFARAGHTATRMADGRTLLVGGDGKGTAELFNPDALTFVAIETNLATTRQAHTAALLQNGRVLIVGGRAKDGEAVQTAEIFDPAALSFIATNNSIHVARTRPTLNVLPDGKVQVIGGDAEGTMEMFNAEGQYFTAYARLLDGPVSPSEILSVQTRAALVQRVNRFSGTRRNVFERVDNSKFDRSDYSFSEIPQSGQVIFAGGINSDGSTLNSTLLLTTSTATVTTDKTDYPPGATAIINGAGFGIGDTITLQVLHTDGTPNTGGGHEPWTVVDGGAGDLDGMADGKFRTTWYVDPDDSLHSAFRLTASGQPSGLSAVTTFTDDNVKNDVIAGGNDTITAGGLTTVNYSIQGLPGDGETGCNATTGSPATVTINTPAGVTATPSSLTFTSCSTNQPVVFTSNIPGDYAITVSVSDSGAGTYNIAPAGFTLHVNPAPTPTPTPCPSGLAISGSVPDFCEGTSQAINLSVTGSNLSGATITWKLDGTTTLTTGTTLSTTLSGLSAGPHSITATASKASCTDVTATTSFTVNPLPTPTITGPVEVCAGGSVTLDAGAGLGSYSWSNGETTQTITVTPGATATYTVTVTNSFGCSASDSHTVTVNPLPTPTITGPIEVCAGGSVTLDAGAGLGSYSWSNGETTQTITVTPGATATYTVTVTNSFGCSASDSHTVTVNPLPTPTITGPIEVCAGGSVTLDAGAGFSSYSWSTGATTRMITVTPSATATYTVTVTNSFNCSASDTHTVTVNPLPTPTITGPVEVCAGSSVMLDAGAGFSGYLWSNGETTQIITVAPGATATYTVTVTNSFGCSASDSHTVTVNPLPTATITAPTSAAFVFAINTPVTFTGTFTGNAGIHNYQWMFDSISGPSGSILGTSGSIISTYTFTQTGVYAVKLTVSDPKCGSATATQVGGVDAMVVIYDPNGGFVTGGGWIMSPAGAYAAGPTLTGKANFGFVSKYKKGATVPTGETEFQFMVANFNFHSTSYEWLVISGAKAQYKGTGTVNGVAGYTFLLTATDGQISGGGGVDKFRIKIWNSSGVVYDNKLGAPDDLDDPLSDPQAIGGGSIVIHKN